MTDPTPPRSVGRVDARSVLVLAPRPEDALLGCGGLLVDLLAQGASVVVTTLESQPTVEGVPPALQALGLRLDSLVRLPPSAGGQKASFLEELIRTSPDLVLAPGLADGDGSRREALTVLWNWVAELRRASDRVREPFSVLLYAVDSPIRADLWVDVSVHEGELLAATQAIEGPGLQRQAEASIALRRYQASTVSTQQGSATLVEAYRRLSFGDLATRSPAQLLNWLEASPGPPPPVESGPLVSVIVRTRDRPALLAEALTSLAEGSYRTVEIVLVNDGGVAPRVAEGYPFPVNRVELKENRGRAGAAQAGVEAATGDYVCFLDDDDLAAPEHLATLVGLVSGTGFRVAYTDAAVAVYGVTPGAGWTCRERRIPYSRDFDPDYLLLDNYIPLNTLIVERALLAEVGPFDESLPFFEDWDLLIRLSALAPFHHLASVTCEYRHFRGGRQVFGERPSEREDFLGVKARVIEKHRDRLGPEVLSRAISVLRREFVAEQEARTEAQTRLSGLVAETQRLYREEAALHNAVALQDRHLRDNFAEMARLNAEDGRARAEETRLREVIADQTSHLQRAYGEISRLTADLESLNTEVARLHAEAAREAADIERLTAELARAAAETGRLYGEEARLDAAVRAQGAELSKAHAEIARLNGEVAELITRLEEGLFTKVARRLGRLGRRFSS